MRSRRYPDIHLDKLILLLPLRNVIRPLEKNNNNKIIVGITRSRLHSTRYEFMSGGNGCLEQLIDLKIIVRYEGLKATQHFSNYTQRSDEIFRDDILTLKLPLPKRENTTFISYGCVECVWPLVPKDGVRGGSQRRSLTEIHIISQLHHKQIIIKINPRNAAEEEVWVASLAKLSMYFHIS